VITQSSIHLNCVLSSYFFIQGNPGVIKGVGVIAKFVNDRSGVIWWYKRHNELQSVWFLASKTFLYGVNLAGKAITEHLHEGTAKLH